MSVEDKLHAAKKKLEAMKKNHRYKKANKDRAIEAEFTYEIAKCAGDLGVCLKDFKYAIEEQSFYIRKGKAEGYNISVQEQQLEDSAVGYMLVKDAMFALRSVYTYDSIDHAYSLLDRATNKITGERTFPFFGTSAKKPKREEYGYLNAQETYEEKKSMYYSFKETLIMTGDIEACIEEYHQNKLQGISTTTENNAFPTQMNVANLKAAADSIPDESTQLADRKRMMDTARFNTGVPTTK